MENLGIDIKLLVAQLINFAIFFFVFKRFMAKPFAKFVKNEKKMQEEKEKILEDLKNQEEKLEKKESEIISKAKKEADAIITAAKKDAQRVKSELLEEAQRQTLELKEKAKVGIEEDKQEIQKQSAEKIVELSFHVINKVLKDVLTQEDRKKITQAILKNSKVKTN